MATQESFLKDVENHVMTVLSDDGKVNRHIRFAILGSSEMQFDVITWPDYLCYTGDMGTYVFRRTHDMLKFFSGKKINLDYWAEKIEAQDKQCGVKEFNENIFNKNVMDYLKTWIRENRQETTKKERRELWERVIDEVVNADMDDAGARKTTAAYDFRHTVNDMVYFQFRDFWEYDFTDYTSRYLWCCHALSWAAKTYFDSLPRVNDDITW